MDRCTEQGPAFSPMRGQLPVDVQFGISSDVEADVRLRQAEVGAARTMLERTEKPALGRNAGRWRPSSLFRSAFEHGPRRAKPRLAEPHVRLRHRRYPKLHIDQLVVAASEESGFQCPPVHCAAGSEGETNFGLGPRRRPKSREFALRDTFHRPTWQAAG